MNWIRFFPFAGFLYLVVLLVIRIIFLKRRGVPVSSNISKRIKFGVIYFVFSLMLLLWMFELAKHSFRFQISILPPVLNNSFSESLVLKTTGIVIIVLALILFTVTLIHFGNSLRFGLNEINRGELITTGVFSFSRNPFFLSLDFYFHGVAILFSSMFFIVFAILTIISIHFFILKEEKFLQKTYGEEYKKYSEKVGRYFSF